MKWCLFVVLMAPLFICQVYGDSPRYWKSSRESETTLEDIKQQISMLRNDLRNQEVELRKLKEKTQSQDQMVESLVDDVEVSTRHLKDQNFGKKLDVYQNEINEIKKHANKLADAINENQIKNSRLEDSVNKQEVNLETIESALTAMMDALGIKDDRFKIYTVKPGDSLGGIAVKHNTTISQIKKTNKLQSDKIIVGQKLKIP